MGQDNRDWVEVIAASISVEQTSRGIMKRKKLHIKIQKNKLQRNKILKRKDDKIDEREVRIRREREIEQDVRKKRKK